MSDFYNWWEGNLRYPFGQYEPLNETYSQAYQDIFVLSLLNGKQNGWYFEVGCGVPKYTNNTYNLYKNFNWNGVSIDFQDYRSEWKEHRPNNIFISQDAFKIDYHALLRNTKVVDYLQLDIEPSVKTYEILKLLPTEPRYAVITFETDIYSGGESVKVREESRKYLQDLGYTLIVPDVIVEFNGAIIPFEDWYVDMNLVNTNVANSIKEMAKHTQDPKKLLFN
jgi:hypothetical protein